MSVKLSLAEAEPKKQFQFFEARLKLGVDHLRAMESLREIVGMCDDELQPASLDDLLAAVLEKVLDLLAAVLEKGWTTRSNRSRCRTSSLLAV